MSASALSTLPLRVTTTTDTPEAEATLLDAIKQLGSSDVVSESIRSFYWWEGAVQNDEEIRLSFSTEKPFDQVLSAIGDAHNYDVPMIIADSGDHGGTYLKGFLAPETDATDIAATLAASRLVACAQVKVTDNALAVKTTAKARAAVEKLAPSMLWTPIVGNPAYLAWLDEETKTEGDRCE